MSGNKALHSYDHEILLMQCSTLTFEHTKLELFQLLGLHCQALNNSDLVSHQVRRKHHMALSMRSEALKP